MAMNRYSPAFVASRLCNSGACVEVAFGTDSVLVRDSKDISQRPLSYSFEEWNSFVLGVKSGQFDVPADRQTAAVPS